MFLKKVTCTFFGLFLAVKAFSLSFSLGYNLDNLYFQTEDFVVSSDSSVVFETEPFKVPVFFGLGASLRNMQHDLNKNTYYFNKNYDDFYFNKGFMFYSGYTFNFPLNNPLFIQMQPAIYYKYSTNEFFRKVSLYSGQTRLTLETMHQIGIFVPFEMGITVKHFSFMIKFNAIYNPFFYLNDDYFVLHNSNYEKEASETYLRFNSFGYSFGILVKYTL